MRIVLAVKIAVFVQIFALIKRIKLGFLRLMIMRLFLLRLRLL